MATGDKHGEIDRQVPLLRDAATGGKGCRVCLPFVLTVQRPMEPSENQNLITGILDEVS